jgi:L-malate glycosyltransferase
MRHIVLHLLSGLQIGGKERVALQLASRGQIDGDDHRLLLFDTPYRSELLDLNPGDVVAYYLPRRPGIDLTLPWRIRTFVRDSALRL